MPPSYTASQSTFDVSDSSDDEALTTPPPPGPPVFPGLQYKGRLRVIHAGDVVELPPEQGAMVEDGIVKYTPYRNRGTVVSANAILFQRFTILAVFRSVFSGAILQEAVKMFGNPYFATPFEELYREIKSMRGWLERDSWSTAFRALFWNLPSLRTEDPFAPQTRCDACRKRHHSYSFSAIIISGRAHDPLSFEPIGEPMKHQFTLGNDCYKSICEVHSLNHLVRTAFLRFEQKFTGLIEQIAELRNLVAQRPVNIDKVVRILQDAGEMQKSVGAVRMTLARIQQRRFSPPKEAMYEQL